MMQVDLPIWLLLVAVCTTHFVVDGRSGGPPLSPSSNFNLVCNEMTPNSLNHGGPLGGNGGYFIDISPSMSEVTNGFTYVGGQTYTIRVVGTGGSTIRGFLVQARVPDNPPPAAPMLLGSFQTGAGTQQTLDCDTVGAAAMATIAHSSNQGDASSVQFDWIAPSTGGTVDFYYTVVRIQSIHFDAQSARQEGAPPTEVPTTPGPTDAPTTPGPTIEPTTAGPTQPTPDNTVAPQRLPEDSRLVFSSPDGCVRANCDIYVGIDTNTGNDSYLDIYLEGTAAGWVAVGFSETDNMFSSDVVACNRVGGDMAALDTWNLLQFQRGSPTDTIQDVYLFTGSFVNGRISCTIAKRIAASDQFDLDWNSNLFVIYARRATESSALSAIETHAGSGARYNPGIQVNPATDATTTEAPTTPGPTTEPLTAGPTQPPPDGAVGPQRLSEDYRLIFSSPDGCARADCDIYVGIDTNTGNDSYLDIYLEGTAAGWVAVGFSETDNMFSADVVACNRVGGDMAALDTWNLPQFQRGSPTDTIQDVYLFNGSFVNGRISCTITKRIAASDQFDLDLNSNLFVIYARRTTESSALMAIETHAGAGTRDFPGIQVNPATDATTTEAPTTPGPTDASTTPGPTTESTTAGPTQPPPDSTVAPQRLPEDYRLVFSSPDGCSLADCNIYVGIDTNTGNDSYLDIYLEGTAAGWVAVGFSETNHMFSADVVACNRVGGDMAALDTWNLPQFQRGSPTDTIQDVYLFTGSFVNGRISCTISKRIAASDQFDLDLNSTLFVIYARRTSESSALMAIETHSGAGARDFPGIQVNPATDATATEALTTPGPTDAPTTPGPTSEPTTAGPTQPTPDNIVAPQRLPDDYRLVFSSPDGCARADCNIYVGIDTNTGNDSYLDIYLEGTAAGWVAVGFSETNDMYSADVVACNRVGGDMAALDTWNLPQFQRGSPTDTIQDVYHFTGSFVNGRISCTIAKRIAASDQFDLDLNRTLFVIFARRTSESSALMAIETHSGAGTRDFPGIQVNPSTDATTTEAPTTPGPTDAPTTSGPTSEPTTAGPTQPTPDNTIAPQSLPEDYRLVIGSPDGCARADCDIYIGIDTNTGNDSYLDIYLEGTAAGWVAVGFSETNDMFSADVVACNRVGGDMAALDTWNLPQFQRGSPTDTIQDVYLFNGSFVNGRISCTTAKRIAASDLFDLDLNSNLFVIYARRTTESSALMAIETHSGAGTLYNPGIQVNPSTDATATEALTTPGPTDASTIPGPTSGPTTAGPTQPTPDNTIAPQRLPEDYRLVIGSPDGCARADCDIYIGIDTNTGNDSYLDIYLEGTSAGWVAVGFSETNDMFSADVVACNRVGGDMAALDTWNLPQFQRGSPTDTIQDVYLFTGSFVNGRISCTIAKRIAASDQFDLDWNRDLFVIYARRTTESSDLMAIQTHSGAGTRDFPGIQVNPATDVTTTDAPTTPGPTTEAMTAGPTQPPPDNTIPPLRSPEDYRLVFSSPDGCARADCNIYVGIDTNIGNDSYLDIYLEGTAAGWVAVGFSETDNMFSADVVACNRVGGDMAALDTWNLPQFQRGSPTDTIQDVYLFNGSFVNGRVSCKIAKCIAASDQFDLDLNRDLFVIYARRTLESSALMMIQTHSDAGTRDFPGIQVNPATDGTSTVVPTTQPTVAPGNPVAPQRSPEEYRLRFSSPEGCNISDCDHFIGIDTNAGDSNYLDIYMEGDAAGWVAVGFSETNNMFSADIVACNRVDDTITALDAWTIASPSRDSRTDTLQDVTLFNSSFVDGRITCTVAKRITLSDQFDLDLNGDLFVIFARRISTSNSGLMRLDTHQEGGNAVRGVAGAQVNPAQSGGAVGGDVFDQVHRPRLIRAHGALMIIAWPLLAVTAIFFALFMRPALPNGEWFQVHRALLIISMFVGTAGFILIFIALSNQNGFVDISSPISVAHFIIGIIVMALHIANPIIAIFRCKPGGKRRWIFNLLHGSLVGLFAKIFALINVGLGIYIFTFTLNLSRFRDSLAPFWLYISWDVFYLVLIMVLFIVFTVSAFISSDENRKKLAPSLAQCFIPPGSSDKTITYINKGIELDVVVADIVAEDSSGIEKEAPKRKSPSKDAYLRWIVMGLLVSVSTIIALILIILIGVPM